MAALNKIHSERTKVVPFTCERAGVISSSDFVSLSFVSVLEDYTFSVRTLFYVYFMALCVVNSNNHTTQSCNISCAECATQIYY